MNTETLISYLNAHKLRSLKAKAFEKWMEIYNFRKSKKQMTLKDFEYIKNKSRLINNLRKITNSLKESGSNNASILIYLYFLKALKDYF